MLSANNRQRGHINNKTAQTAKSVTKWQWELTSPYTTHSSSLTLPLFHTVPRFLISNPNPIPIPEELSSATAPLLLPLPQMTNPFSSQPLSTTSTLLPIWVALTPPSPPMPLLASRYTHPSFVKLVSNLITVIQFDYCYCCISLYSAYWERKWYSLLELMNMVRKLQLLLWPRVPLHLTIVISFHKLTGRFGKM